MLADTCPEHISFPFIQVSTGNSGLHLGMKETLGTACGTCYGSHCDTNCAQLKWEEDETIVAAEPWMSVNLDGPFKCVMLSGDGIIHDESCLSTRSFICQVKCQGIARSFFPNMVKSRFF